MSSFPGDDDLEFSVDDDPVIDESDVKDLVNMAADESHVTIKPVQAKRCKRCPFIVEPMMITFMLVAFAIPTLIPEYIRNREWIRLTGTDNYTTNKNKCLSTGNNTLQDDPYHANMSLASSAASYFDMEVTFISSVPAIFAVLFLCPFSDKAGRKYSILAPIVGQMVAVFSCSATAAFNLPKELILVGFFIYGCTGLRSSFYSGCYSYISDTTSLEQRSFRIVMASLTVFISAVLSTAGSGFMVNLLGFGWVFFIMFVLNALLVFYAIFLVPETINPKGPVKFFTTVHIKNAFTVVLVDHIPKRRWKLLVLLGALLAERLVAGSASIDTLFSLNRPLCWGVDLVGIYTGVRHGISMVGCGAIMWIFKSHLRDEWFCIISCISALTANVFKFFVKTTAMMFGSAVIEFAIPLLETTIRSMLIKLVRPDEAGAIQSSVGVSELVCRVIGHLVTNPLYSATERGGHPSAVFLYMASWFLVCLVILSIYTYLTRNREQDPRDDMDNTTVKSE